MKTEIFEELYCSPAAPSTKNTDTLSALLIFDLGSLIRQLSSRPHPVLSICQDLSPLWVMLSEAEKRLEPSNPMIPQIPYKGNL